jgi:phytoene synthase
MKISAFALSAALALGSANAFLGHNVGARCNSASCLQSLATPRTPGKNPGGRSEDEIHHELSSGKILEGGKVIDFESVKGPSRAEQALAVAKADILKMSEHYVPDTASGILGINDDVVSEVGHELGNFATREEVQGAAAYLRSKAPAGLLQTRTNGVNGEAVNGVSASFTPEQKKRYESILSKAFEESGEVTGAFAKTFYMGTQLLPVASREAIWAVYVWCRRTDEIVDAPRENDDDMLLDLASWEMRLENLWKYGDVEDVYDLCFLDVLVNYPTLPITPFMDMVRGMLMDVPELGQDRYETFDELHLYCYRVAGTVGLMSLPIFGCAQGYDDIIAK